jgi:DNA polymerase/3'-5' exonuclease PolX
MLNWLHFNDTPFLADPYSVEGLRLRASKLPNCAYRVLLELAATQLEDKKIDKATVKKIIEYARTGKLELLTVAIKMLELSQEQTAEVLSLLKTGTIKDVGAVKDE